MKITNENINQDNVFESQGSFSNSFGTGNTSAGEFSLVSGSGNTVDANSKIGTILGGCNNNITNYTTYSSIIGGAKNIINNASNCSSIIGGQSNYINQFNLNSSVVGGSGNTIYNTSNNSAIIGGTGNTMDSSRNSVIIGGSSLSLSGEDNTTFVDKLKVNTLTLDNTTTKILTSDVNGNVKYRNVSSFGVGSASYFFYKTNSTDVPAYYIQKQVVPPVSAQTISNAGVINGQILASFITLSGSPGNILIPNGIGLVHIHATKTAGTKTAQLYFEIFKRDSGGTETLLAQTANSDVLTGSDGEYFSDFTLSATTLLSTDFIVTKVYAYITGGGSAPDITLTIEDYTTARLELPYTQIGGGGGGTPAGNNTEVQFNDGGVFGANSGFTFDKTLNSFIVSKDSTQITTATSSAIVGGCSNSILSYSHNGSTIGGKTNCINNYSLQSSIIGGTINIISSNSCQSSIIGGCTNTVSCSPNSSIIGGCNNSVLASTTRSGIFNGYTNTICATNQSAIIGGGVNVVCTSAFSSIVGGAGNSIKCNVDKGSIIGGSANILCGAHCNTTIIGGIANTISGSSSHSTIISSSFTRINPTSLNSTIISSSGSTLSNSNRSVILGGSGLTLSNSADTVFVSKLKINSISNDDTLTQILAADAGGNVLFRNASTLSGTTTTSTGNTLTFYADGNGGVVSVGRAGGIWRSPYSGTITGWYLQEGTNTSATTTLDVWKKLTYPPTSADTIFVTKPSLSSATTNSSTGLSIGINSGDYFAFNVVSNASAQILTLELLITK